MTDDPLPPKEIVDETVRRYNYMLEIAPQYFPDYLEDEMKDVSLRYAIMAMAKLNEYTEAQLVAGLEFYYKNDTPHS